MKAKLDEVTRDGKTYKRLAFVCPGCAEAGGDGVHMLPVNSQAITPSWDWNEDLERPTLKPSILTHGADHEPDSPIKRCHCYLTDGVFHFLDDSEHSLKGQRVPMPDLPDWVVHLHD